MMHADDLTGFGTVSLGGLIRWLERLSGKERTVRFDFCGVDPTAPQSYRGYYDHLALGWEARGQSLPVGTLLRLLWAANGETYAGYKGGNYRMTLATPLWVANYGESSGTGIVGVDDSRDWCVILKTDAVDV